MRLDRNGPNGRGKYAVIKMRRLEQIAQLGSIEDVATVGIALDYLERMGVLTYGAAGTADEFFVMMLKDRNARPALLAYAASAGDNDYGRDVTGLAIRAGYMSPWCKDPD
jgi:hypothetical protein